jgi:hypothetical protein
MAMMSVFSVVELIVRSLPSRIHSAAWRIEFIGGAANVVGTVVLALFVTYGIAMAADDKVVAYLVSSMASLGAALCVIAIGIFALDAIQVKAQMQSSLSPGYDAGTIWVVVRIAIAACILVVIAASSLRAGRNARRDASARPTQRPSVLVTTPRGSGPAVPQTPPGSSGRR